MDKDVFLKNLAKLGYPLFDVEKPEDDNIILAEMVKSDDSRILEGFPLVLANSANKSSFDYKAIEGYLEKNSDKDKLHSLIAMSLALYAAIGIKFSWADKLYKILKDDDKEMFNRLLESLKKNNDINIKGSCVVSGERLRKTFNNYFNQERSDLKDILSVKEEMALEYALSQVFSAKQKELFLKKLRREKLTKTEREYFSRVVKKKILALANTELHALSKKLLEE